MGTAGLIRATPRDAKVVVHFGVLPDAEGNEEPNKDRRLPLPGAHCRWKAGLRTEVALDRLHLVIFKPEILYVAERLAVFGPTDVHHKRLVAVAKYKIVGQAPL